MTAGEAAPGRPLPPWRHALVVFAAVAAGYAVGSQLAYSWFGADGLRASFFPAAGVTMAALLLTRRALWPVVLVAAGLAEFTMDQVHGLSVAAAAGYVVANVAQPLAGALVVRRLRPRVDLTRSDDLLVYLVAAVVAAPALGAALGATAFTAIDGNQGWLRFAGEWWVGDALGVLVVGTALIALRDRLIHPQGRAHDAEAVLLGAACAAASIAVFWWGWSTAALVLLLLMIVTGFRLGTWAVAVIGAVVAFVGAEATSQDREFWRTFDIPAGEGVLHLQIALGVVLMGALGIAAEVRGRERTAEEVGGDRRQRELADAAPAMLWVTDAAGRCTFLSRGWHDFTGRPGEDDPDRVRADAIHPEDRPLVLEEFARAAAGHSTFTSGYRLRRADGAYRRVIDAARPRRDPDGRFHGYAGTVLDVDDHLRVEEALHGSDAQLRVLFAAIDEGYALCEMVLDEAGTPVDYRFLDVNTQFETMTGLTDVIGRTVRELVPGIEPRWVEIYARVALDGRTSRFEESSEVMGRVFDVFATPVGAPGRFALVFRDITARRLAERAKELSARRDRFRSRLTDRMRDMEDAGAIAVEAARGIAAQLGVSGAFVGELDADGRLAVVAHRRRDGVAPLAGRHRLDELMGDAVALLRDGRTVVVAAPGPADDTLLGRAGAHAVVGLTRGGRLVGVFAVHDGAPHEWTREEVALVQGVAQRAGLAMQRARSERALRESESLFRSLADTVPDLVWLTDRAGRFEFLNAACSTFVGRPAEDLRAGGWRDCVHPDDLDAIRRTSADAFARRRRLVVEARIRRADGEYRWTRTLAEPREADGRYAGHVGSTVDIHDVRLDRDREALLARVSGDLDRGVGVRERLDRLSRLLVEEGVADHCRIIVPPDGTRPPVRVRAARVPAHEAIIDRLDGAAGISIDSLARRGPAVLEEVGDDFLRELSGDDAGLDLRRSLDLRSAMWAPLVARGRHLGVLAVARSGEQRYSQRDLATLVEVARHAAFAIDNARLYEAEVAARREAERSRARLGELHGLTAQLSAAATATEVARLATAAIAAGTGAPRACLVAAAPGAEALSALATVGYRPDEREHLTAMPLDPPDPLARWCRDGEALFVEDPAEVRRRVPGIEGAGHPVGALAFAPIEAGGVALFFDSPRTFSPTDRAHLRAMATVTAQALQRARRFEDQRTLSWRLQRSLLPATLPEVPGMSLAHDYRPRTAGTEAGGDWYDALALAGGRLAITVGDVVGHGLEAAAVMGQVRSALNGFLIAGSSPGAALAQLNAFAHRVDGASCASAVCLIVEVATGRVTWSRAGHPPPCVVTPRGADLREDVNGPLLGVVGDATYPEAHFTLPEGGAILIYTDGLVERRGEHLDAGLARLAGVAGRAPRSHAARLLAAVQHGALPPGGGTDDVALVALVRHVSESRLTAAAGPADLAGIRRTVRRRLAPLALARDELDDVMIAVGEAIANAVEHAYRPGRPGSIRIDLRHTDDGEVVIAVHDDGRWRRRADSPDRGRGMMLMRAVMDEVSVVATDTGTCVELLFRPRSDPGGASPRPAVPPAPFAVRAEPDAGRTARLRVRGDIDEATAPALDRAIDALLRRPGPGGTLDLGEASHLGSVGVRTIIEASRRAGEAGVRLAVRAPRGGIARRVLEASGVADQLELAAEPDPPGPA